MIPNSIPSEQYLLSHINQIILNLRNLVNNGTLSEQDGMYELVSGINNTVANPRNNGRFCAECGNKNNLTECCNEVYYCGDDCKEMHVPVHKLNCTLRCVNCGEEGELTECCCGGVKYCSEECRIAHLPKHKIKCSIIEQPECVLTTKKQKARPKENLRGYCKYCGIGKTSWTCGTCSDATKIRFVHPGECFRKHLKAVHNIELDELDDEAEDDEP